VSWQQPASESHASGYGCEHYPYQCERTASLERVEEVLSRARSTSKSAISRRFVAATKKAMEELMANRD